MVDGCPTPTDVLSHCKVKMSYALSEMPYFTDLEKSQTTFCWTSGQSSLKPLKPEMFQEN
jgi:hypothetical protein